jgi:two-component system cell cycle sensor histidine kinase/response regulator CckA
MTSVAHAGHLQAAPADDACSDLNQVVARAESAILDAIGREVSVEFALSPNVARVAVTVAELQKIVIALCAQARSGLAASGRLVVETRGLNDAHVAPPKAQSVVADARARLIVRAEETGQVASRAPDLKSAVRPDALGLPALEALLEPLGGQLERVPLAGQRVAYVAHLPYVPPTSSSGSMPVAVARGLDVILLIEDEPQVQAVTARILRAFGYSVITAHDERTALAQAVQHGAAISLVVSDLVLPGVSGTDLVRRLRQPCEHARVLYMSGYSSEHVGPLVAGAKFLRKPFTAEELVTVVRDLLEPSVR